MPPIPSTLDEETSAQIDALERRQKDLRDFQIPRLRTFDGSLATQQQYAAEVREDIDAFARQVESLEIAVDDQKVDRNRRELRRIVDEYREVLIGFRKESRAALLASKRAIDAKRTSNREELFQSRVVREKQDLNEKVAEDAVMTASNNLTEALQRTMTLMQGELEKSVLSTQLLDQSTANLRSASTTHDVLDGLLTTSKHLITALEKSDWVDRVIIMAALVFFVLVVLFILKQRLVDRSIRLAFWWTRFLPGFGATPSNVSDKVLDAIEKGSITSMTTEVVSTVLATASATLLPVASSLASSSESRMFNEPSTPLPNPTPTDILSLVEEISSTMVMESTSADVVDVDETPSLPTSLTTEVISTVLATASVTLLPAASSLAFFSESNTFSESSTLIESSMFSEPSTSLLDPTPTDILSLVEEISSTVIAESSSADVVDVDETPSPPPSPPDEPPAETSITHPEAVSDSPISIHDEL